VAHSNVPSFILLLALLSTGGFVLSGCTGSSDQSPPPGQGQRNLQDFNRTGFSPGSTMTDEQRQQMMQAAIFACSGKADGDACVIQNSRGDMNGTCRSMNGTLSCAFARGGRGLNGTWNGQRQP